MKSWEEVGDALAKSKDYSVSDVLEMIARDEKDKVYQSIDNCMIVLEKDPILKGAICHNDLTCKMDLRKDLGWGKPEGGGIRDVDINQIEWYLERTYGLKNYNSHLALSFQATIAEEESRVRSRSMESSLRMRLDHGLPLTPELLGFMHDENGKLIINPETYKIPKLMFAMYL